MSDFFGLSTAGPLASAARPPRPAVPLVIAAQASNPSGSGTTQRDPNSDPAPDRHLLSVEPHPGPSPAFETSLLELDADLQSVIRKMQAAREQARDLHAIAPDAPSPTPDEPPTTQTESAAQNPYD